MRNALQSDMKLHKPDLFLEIPVTRDGLLSKKYIKEYYTTGYQKTVDYLAALAG